MNLKIFMNIVLQRTSLKSDTIFSTENIALFFTN